MRPTQSIRAAISDDNNEDHVAYRESGWIVQGNASPTYEMVRFLHYQQRGRTHTVFTKVQEIYWIGLVYRVRHNCDFFSIHNIVADTQISLGYAAYLTNRRNSIAEMLDRVLSIQCDDIAQIVANFLVEPKYVVFLTNQNRADAKPMYADSDAVFFDNMTSSDTITISMPWYTGIYGSMVRAETRYTICGKE